MSALQVSAAREEIELGETTVVIGGGGQNINIPNYDSFTWEKRLYEDGINLIANIQVQDGAMGNPRDIAVEYTLTATEYPQGQNGNPGGSDSDSWSTPGWQPSLVSCNGNNGPWNGEVDVDVDWDLQPMEILVVIEVEVYEDDQGDVDLIDSDSEFFWISCFNTDIGLGANKLSCTINIANEAAFIPNVNDMKMWNGDSWTLVVIGPEIIDNCDETNTRGIRIKLSLIVTDYPNGQGGPAGNIIAEDYKWRDAPDSYLYYDGGQDLEEMLGVACEFGNPVGNQEYKVEIIIEVDEQGQQNPILTTNVTFWISEFC